MWIDRLAIEHCEKPLTCLAWVPTTSTVVLGNANQFELECEAEACKEDTVSVLRRAGGGGAVVLHEGCVVVSVGAWVEHYYRNGEYFKRINEALIGVLQDAFPSLNGFAQAGISDVVFNGKKIAGTSLFRSRNYLLYQASLLVDERLDIIERYLKHPSREPEYRQRKSHREFLTHLNELTKSSPDEVKALFQETFYKRLKRSMDTDLIEPPGEQVQYLKRRFFGGPNIEHAGEQSHTCDQHGD